MSAYASEQSLSRLSPDMRRLLEIQLTSFIDYLDEASVRARSPRKAMVTTTANQSLYRFRRTGANIPAA